MDKLIEYVQVLLEQLGLGTIEASFYIINILIFILLFKYFLGVLVERKIIEEEFKLEKFNALNNFIMEYRLYKSDTTRSHEMTKSMYIVIPFMNKKVVDKIIDIEQINIANADSLYNELKSHFDLARANNKKTHILNNHESVFGVFESFFRLNGVIQLIMTFVYALFSWFAFAAVLLITYRFFELTTISRILVFGMITIGVIYMFLLLFVLDGLAFKGVKINIWYILCIVISFIAPYSAAFENWFTVGIYGGSLLFLTIMAFQIKKEILNLP